MLEMRRCLPKRTRTSSSAQLHSGPTITLSLYYREEFGLL